MDERIDEDFGFVERRPNSGLKNGEEKLTNGRSDQLDQSLRTLSLSNESGSTPSSVPSSNKIEIEVNNNSYTTNNRLQNEDKMLKHTKKSSTSSNPTITINTGDSTPNLQKSSQNPSKVSIPSQGTDNQVTLPQRFVVKYLGYRDTSNLWGIKYTRLPVDEMVKEAKEMLSQNGNGTGGRSLPLLKLEVTDNGISVGAMPQNNNTEFPSGKFVIEAISYGVQDLVYTRVFAMIVVKSALAKDGQAIKLSDLHKVSNGGSDGDSLPFRCHAFVCDSRQTARKLTYSLATAFHKFSQCVAAGKVTVQKPKKFAIDLRSSEEIEADLLDSEA